jgi:hypothetical protein
LRLRLRPKDAAPCSSGSGSATLVFTTGLFLERGAVVVLAVVPTVYSSSIRMTAELIKMIRQHDPADGMRADSIFLFYQNEDGTIIIQMFYHNFCSFNMTFCIF